MFGFLIEVSYNDDVFVRGLRVGPLVDCVEEVFIGLVYCAAICGCGDGGVYS